MPDAATITTTRLPRAAPRPVLALGAYLNNRACLLHHDLAWWSPLNGDLDAATHCEALVDAARALLTRARDMGAGPIAIAHDRHPDFFSTRLALQLGAELGVPAVAVQHHHAHIAAVQAEAGLAESVIGISLDGVGLGDDGTAWGGEILWVAGCASGPHPATDEPRFERRAHLGTLAMAGGDRAALEPWRLAAAVLHRLGRGEEIVPRFAASAGEVAARTVRSLLERAVLSPPTTAAGRWFDAAAAALGVHTGPQTEAEAPQALQATAQRWLDTGKPLPEAPAASLDLLGAVQILFDVPPAERPRAAAAFHATVAAAVAGSAIAEARAASLRTVALGGGCFVNRILRQAVRARLEAAGLHCAAAQHLDCGDSALALGQAWLASWVTLSQDRDRGHTA